MENIKLNTENDVQSLATIFKEGLDNYNSIINSDQPTNSNELQAKIKGTMKIFEQATRLVTISSIFGTNEDIEEIPTNDLQYFLLPALLGSLVLKLTTGERREIVDVAEVYFKDFLKRCSGYGISNYQLKNSENDNEEKRKREQTEMEKLEMSVNTRAKKIQRFQEQKELKLKLKDLKKNMENEHADEEIKREYFLMMIKLFIHEAIDELSSIEMEKPILEHMASMKKEEKPQVRRPPPQPLKPIIITKDEMQRAVFGAGYPSLPVMTVQEFYEKRVQDGIFPDPNKPKTEELSLQEAALAGVSLNSEEKDEEEQEKLVEEDNEENIARMRAKDDFKDEHRRGWGNRMNRS